MTNVLTTSKQVIDALGGTVATMDAVGAKSPQVVSYWRRNHIPPKLIPVVNGKLREIGMFADFSAFGIKDKAP